MITWFDIFEAMRRRRLREGRPAWASGLESHLMAMYMGECPIEDWYVSTVGTNPHAMDRAERLCIAMLAGKLEQI